jgi:hypothetical protein
MEWSRQRKGFTSRDPSRKNKCAVARAKTTAVGRVSTFLLTGNGGYALASVRLHFSETPCEESLCWFCADSNQVVTLAELWTNQVQIAS